MPAKLEDRKETLHSREEQRIWSQIRIWTLALASVCVYLGSYLISQCIRVPERSKATAKSTL